MEYIDKLDFLKIKAILYSFIVFESNQISYHDSYISASATGSRLNLMATFLYYIVSVEIAKHIW